MLGGLRLVVLEGVLFVWYYVEVLGRLRVPRSLNTCSVRASLWDVTMTSMFPAVILGSAAMLGMLGSANAAEMNITQFKLLESIRDGIESSDVCDYMDGCACPTAEWSTMENPCGWPGITCDNGTESRQVVGLSLNFCELTDVPTPTLGLTSLLTLDLSDNFLTDLPSGLDALPLERLYLSGNIMRVLPLVVFELGLEVLHAARNLLDDVPPEIGALSWTLDEINLAYNSLGNISDHFCECESIGVANFAHAGLTGPLPMCLGELDSLRHLDLSHNSVIFPVDDQDRSLPDLTNCTSLEWLDLSGAIVATVSRRVHFHLLTIAGKWQTTCSTKSRHGSLPGRHLRCARSILRITSSLPSVFRCARPTLVPAVPTVHSSECGSRGQERLWTRGLLSLSA